MSRIHVTYDIGPAVHQGAGLAKYAERLAVHLLAGQRDAVDLTLFYNAHSGHRPPASLAAAPARTLPLGQLAWRLSVLAGHLTRRPYPGLKAIVNCQLLIVNGQRPTAANHQPLTINNQSINNQQSTINNQQLTINNQQSTILYHATEHLLPYLPTTPTVLTVHDLIFERYPQHHTWRNMLYLRAAMPRYVAAATAIIAVSQQTKADLVELYGADADKIFVVYEGIDAAFAPAPAAEMVRVRTQYSPDAPTCSWWARWSRARITPPRSTRWPGSRRRASAYRLLVVGGQGWRFAPIRQLVDDLGLAGDVTFTGYVPLADLPPLYTGADCVLLPSLYEGFGFPALEAMACAAPVVCSNASSLPEVAGGAALHVPPHDPTALAAAVRLVVTQPALADVLRRRGPIQAARFRWESCAAENRCALSSSSALPARCWRWRRRRR
jgi:glycosyltransferase involved in cell wall biosynthesis